MQLTNEQLQAILNGAPEGATHIDPDGDYWVFYDGDKYLWTNGWDFCCSDYPLRELGDLREILQLRQEVERLRNVEGKLAEQGYDAVKVLEALPELLGRLDGSLKGDMEDLRQLMVSLRG